MTNQDRESLPPVALALLRDGRIDAAEACLAGLPPESLTRWASAADALAQVCLAVARRAAPATGVPAEELTTAREAHERVHPEVYGLPPSGPTAQPFRLTLAENWDGRLLEIDDFGDDDESEDPT